MTFVQSNGAKYGGYDDHFMLFLQDNSNGKNWPNMTDGERYTSARNNNLVWTGTNVVSNSGFLTAGKTAQGKVKLFAPNPYQTGSSVSHWDTSLNPDELMEPYATSTSNDTLTKMAFKDMGWKAGSPTPPTPTPGGNGTSLVPVYELLLGSSKYPELPLDTQMLATVELNEWQYYTINLPAGAANLTVNLFNLSADLDLYIKAGTPPTLFDYDCRPWLAGTTAEQCSLPTNGEKTWFAGIYGARAGNGIIFATDN